MTERLPVIPPGSEFQYEKLHFAPALRVGDTLHVSGVIGTNPDGSCSDDPATQFKQAFEGLAAVMEAAGGTLADIVEMTTFHVGLQANMRTFIQVMKQHIVSEPWPAWTAIGITELAIPGGMVEIRATADLG